MKKKIGLFIKTAIFLCLLGICLFGCSLIVQRKSSYIKNEMYMQEAEKNNIDVFILGSSHVINGINPIQLFEEKGEAALVSADDFRPEYLRVPQAERERGDKRNYKVFV